MQSVTIEVDDALIAAAMRATGLDSAKDAVEEWLRRIAREEAQRRAIAGSAGIGWEGPSLDDVRASRF